MADPKSEWDSLPDAPSDWDSLPDAPKGGFAAEMGEGLTKLAGSAASGVWNGVKKAGSDMAGMVTEGVPAAINFLKDSAGKSAQIDEDLGTNHELVGNPMWMAKQALSAVGGMGVEAKARLDKLPPNERKAALTRIGTTAALVMAAGPEAGVLRQSIAGVLGDIFGGEISQKAGFEKDTPFFTKENAEKEVAVFTENLLIPSILKVGGKVLKSAGGAFERASVPIENLRKAQKAKPGYLAGQSTIGKNTGNEMALVSQLKDGEKTFAKVVADEIPEGIKDADKLAEAVNNSITKRVVQKKRVMGKLETGLANPGAIRVSGFTRREAGYPEITQQIRKLKKTGIGADAVADLESLQKDLTSAFSSARPQGQTGIISRRKSFGEMSDLLDQVYSKMRSLKAFDPKNAIKASEVEANKQAIAGYKAVANKIKSSMVDKARQLESQGLVDKGTATKLGELNQEIHELIPFGMAMDRFAYSEYQTLRQNAPGSLIQKSGSPFRNGETMVHKAIDIATEPVTAYPVERQSLRESLDFTPETMSNMRESADMMLGREPIPSIEPQGLTGKVIGPAEKQLGSGLLATQQSGIVPVLNSSTPGALALEPTPTPVVQPPVLSQLANSPTAGTTEAFKAIVSDPSSIQILENDPDIDPQTVAQLVQSKNGTAYEQQKALGQLKIEARNKGWFPPPPMQGIHSFIETPDIEYRGTKVMGTITDPAEGALFLDAVNQIPDVSERIRIKSAFNSSGKYVVALPSSLWPKPTPEKKKVEAEPKSPDAKLDEGSSTAKIDINSGSTSMARIVHDY